MNKVFLGLSVVLLSGCSSLTSYVATPDSVIERQKQEAASLTKYHSTERDYYKAKAISDKTGGADKEATDNLESAEEALEAAKPNFGE